MSIYDQLKAYAKMKAQQSTAQSTADSSNTTVSKPKTTTTNQKSEATYWQATQQTENKKSTQKALRGKKEATYTRKKTPQPSAGMKRAKQNKYAEAKKKAEKYNPEATYDYSQANAGIEAILSGKNAEQAMRDYANQNKTKMRLDRVARERQAEYAQAQVDTAREDINKNPVTKAVSDTALSALGGVTAGIGGQFKIGSNLAQGLGGLTGDKDLVERAQKFDEDLGVRQAIRNVNRNNMVADNMVGKVAQSIGNMVPTIAGNVMSGGSNAVGLGVMGASVFGNSGSEAMRNLSSDGDLSSSDALRGLGYGLGSAGLEVATEKLSDFIPGLDTFAFTNPNNMLGQAGGEALEEMISSAAEPLLNPLANQSVTNADQYSQDVYNNTFGDLGSYGRDILESGVLGGATSLAMGGGANAVAGLNNLAMNSSFANTMENGADAYQMPNTPPVARTDVANEAEPVMPKMSDLPADQQTTSGPEQTGEYPDALKRMVTPSTDMSNTLNMPEYRGAVPEVEMTEVNPNATQAAELDSTELSDQTYSPSASDNLQVANEEGEVVEPQAEKGNIASRLADRIKSFFKKSEAKSDNPSMDYILSHVREAVTAVDAEASPSESVSSDSPEVVSVSNEILQDINDAHQALTAIPKNEAQLGDLAVSEAKGTMIEQAEKMGDTFTAEKMKADPKVGLYNTISDKFLLRSADEVYRDVGLDGMREIILRPELIENKGVSGMMITYCNKYAVQAKQIRDTFLADNKLTFTDGKWLQDGKPLSTNSDAYKTIQQMDENNWKVVEATVQYRSNAGYALRACQLMNNITPEYRLVKLDQWIEKTNSEIHKLKGGRKNTSIGLITESEKTAYLTAKTDLERSDILKRIENRVRSEMPAGLSERMSQWRYLMMLANPATHVRNIFGNVLMQGMTSAKNAITYGVEKAFYQNRRFTSQIDLSNASDVQIKNYAQSVPFTKIGTEFSEYLGRGLNKQGRSARRAFWESKGYSGKTLKYLSSGAQFATDGVTRQRWGNSLANIIKQNGYTVNDQMQIIDTNGKVLDDASVRDLVQQGFEDSLQHYVDSSQFARVNEQGKATFTNRAADKALFDYAEIYFDSVADEESSKDAGKWNANGISQNENVFEKTRSKLFNKTLGKGIDWVANKNNDLLNKEDRRFTKFRFRSEFATQLKLNGYTVENNVLMKDGKVVDLDSKEVLQMQEYAYEEALESVFRDTNRLAKALAKMRTWNGGAKFAIDAIMPFTTTPMNITKRIAEYSPIGFTRGLWNTIHSVDAGTVDAQTAINRLARGTTGTGLLLLGAFLASIGWITGKKDDDDRTDKYEANLGRSPEYAIQFADGSSYTLDWAAPSGAILLLGATMHDRLQGLRLNEGDDFTHNSQTVMDWLLSSGSTVLDPVMDMTVLSGIQDLFEGYAQGDKKTEGIIENILKNYTGQFTPTIGAKINKIIDDTKRTTYSDTWIDSIVRQNMNKIPMMSTLLEPALDYKGNDISNTVYDTGDETLNGLINTAYYMLSPGNYTRDKSTSYDEELISVARASGNNYITPTTFSYLTNQYNEKFKFTPEERTELNRYYAQTYKAEIEKFMNSDGYDVYDQNGREGILEKSKIMDSIQRHVYNMTKEKYFSKVTPDAPSTLYASDIAAEKMHDLGMDYYQFYEMKAIESDKDSEGETIPLSKAINVRNYLENHGVYENIVKAINAGTLEPKDVNLTKTVVGWTAKEYEEKYQELMNNLADETYKVSQKKSSNGKKTASTGYSRSGRSTGSRRSSGSSTSSSTDSDPVKIAASVLNYALTQSKRNTGSIQTKISTSASDTAQSLYNSIMSDHEANLNSARQYTHA